jgi:hypothetical protein
MPALEITSSERKGDDMRIIRSTRFWIAAAVVAAASAGAAYATIPDSDGVIHACYAKSGGALRVIDDSVTNCKSGETAVSWNQSGQPGPPGPAGETAAWSDYKYARDASEAYPSTGGGMAHFTFTSPAAGYAVVTANFTVRIRNHFDTTQADCRVQTQIAPTAGAPDEAAPGFVDQWVNGNLPTQVGVGTFLGLNESTTRVLPVEQGQNIVFLNGKVDQCQALLGPLTMTAVLVQSNPTATLTEP